MRETSNFQLTVGGLVAEAAIGGRVLCRHLQSTESRGHMLQDLFGWVPVRLQHCIDEAYSKQEQRKDEGFGTNIKDSTKSRVTLMA
jgi:hypothetical protein